MTVEGRVKTENEKVFNILDYVNDAIDKGCKIRFQYTEYNNRKRKVMKHSGEYYIVSPYVLVWDGDYYYLIGYCDNRDHMRNFRLDRFYRAPMILEDEEAVPVPKDFTFLAFLCPSDRFPASFTPAKTLCTIMWIIDPWDKTWSEFPFAFMLHIEEANKGKHDGSNHIDQQILHRVVDAHIQIAAQPQGLLAPV